MIKLIVLDRDGIINEHSCDVNSPSYYILSNDAMVIKEGVVESIKKLATLKVPIVLATKQRCVGKGLISAKELDEIHEHLQQLLGFWFQAIYIEESDGLKTRIFGHILNDYAIEPEEAVVVDDSLEQITVAYALGFKTVFTQDLEFAVDKIFLGQFDDFRCTIDGER